MKYLVRNVTKVSRFFTDYNSANSSFGEMTYDTESSTVSYVVLGRQNKSITIDAREIKKIRYKYFRVYIHTAKKRYVFQLGRRPPIYWQWPKRYRFSDIHEYRGVMRAATYDSEVFVLLSAFYENLNNVERLYKWWYKHGVYTAENAIPLLEDQSGAVLNGLVKSKEGVKIIEPINIYTENYILYLFKRYFWYTVLAIFIVIMLSLATWKI